MSVLEELEEIEASDFADVEIDKAMFKAMIAIARIAFARFDNIDEQLRVIDGKLGAPANPAVTGTISVQKD